MGKKKIILFIILLFIGTGCAQGSWKGKVLDAETKEPIKDAVVVAVWEYGYPALGSNVGGIFLEAKETLTDKNGEFKMPAVSYLNIPFFREIEKPIFTIFKPGYGYKIKNTYKNEYKVIELPKLKEKTTRQENLNEIKLWHNAPGEKTPLLNKSINAEEKNIEAIKLEEIKRYGLDGPPLIVTKKTAADEEASVTIKRGQGLMFELKLEADIDLELKDYNSSQLSLLGTYKSTHGAFIWQWVFKGEKPGTSVIVFEEKGDSFAGAGNGGNYTYFKINVKVI